MSQNSLGNLKKCLVNTGNILALNDITRKSSQNPSDELTEAINITLKEYQTEHTKPLETNSGSGNTDKILIYRSNDDLQSKIAEQSLQDLKIGLKVFIDSDRTLAVEEAVEEAFATLKIPCAHNVIIALNNKNVEHRNDLDVLKKIWTRLERYVTDDKINQIGVADVEEATFRNIYEWAKVKPAIIQINLATCCVVPPTLQQFCKENEVQLLTHSDPLDMLPSNKIKELFGTPLPLRWILRFLVHITCRGVLITKGYLVNLGDNQ